MAFLQVVVKNQLQLIHIKPVCKSLLWLPASLTANFRTSVLIYEVLKGLNTFLIYWRIWKIQAPQVLRRRFGFLLNRTEQERQLLTCGTNRNTWGLTTGDISQKLSQLIQDKQMIYPPIYIILTPFSMHFLHTLFILFFMLWLGKHYDFPSIWTVLNTCN